MAEESQYNAAVEAFRDREYPMLRDTVYLDHAGATLPSKSLMDAFAADMTSVLYGNPHSGSLSSQLSAARIDDTRLRLLLFFKADPARYDLVFVANATAGIKLVLEGMRSLPRGFSFAYHEACHTSVVGLREDAQQNACLDDAAVRSWLDGRDAFSSAPQSKTSAHLFAFSAQSHMDGKRFPLSWSRDMRRGSRHGSPPTYTLLDIASLAATSQVDFAHPDFDADFTVLSLYKIFGFPDLGALIVKRSAESIWDHRRYFGGGTVDMVLCGKEQYHVPKSRLLHERLEDGTLPFHSIMAVDSALSVHARTFGSMQKVSSHTSFLCHQLFHSLSQLRHGNGRPVCLLYTALPDGPSSLGYGPVVSFNIRDSKGHWIGLSEFEKLAILKGIHIRTGGLCSPARMASTLGLQPWEMRKNLSAGFKCGEDMVGSSTKPAGVIRASLGAMSTQSDVQTFVNFVREFFVEAHSRPTYRKTQSSSSSTPIAGLRVRAITVFPIKSCGGLKVPPGTPWEVRPEGLAWDREWCLIHRGSGQVLSQKRYNKMALLQPSLNLDRAVLRVAYRGEMTIPGQRAEIDIPLANDAAFFDTDSCKAPLSKVCGESIRAQAYLSESINAFFSDALGVPCVLARFPAGGRGSTCRLSKARLSKHQKPSPLAAVAAPERPDPTIPGSFPDDVPSPPDSDSEPPPSQQPPTPLPPPSSSSSSPQTNILLSNESPILMIHSASVDQINRDIAQNNNNSSNGHAAGPVSEYAFRANIILQNHPGHEPLPAYSEDFWTAVRIGDQDFVTLGACQRCQMVCVDQDTAERRQEPLSTLAKTRRIDSKVYFGVHMRHDLAGQGDAPPTIQVGDAVSVERNGA